MYTLVDSKLLRDSMGNRDHSNVDYRLEIDECRLPLIVHFYMIEHRASATISVAIRDDYNRPCMYLHVITLKVIRLLVKVRWV